MDTETTTYATIMHQSPGIIRSTHGIVMFNSRKD